MTAQGSGAAWSFRLAGFGVSVPWSALVGIAIIALLWYPEFARAGTAVGQWTLAAGFGVLLMASVLLHELAHAVAARAFGYPVAGITLSMMGGVTSYLPGRRHGPAREATIALAGPLTTLALAALAWWAAGLLGAGIARDLVLALASANVLVGIFNLLPGLPLDGGAVVKALVWAVSGSAATGQVVAGWVGRALALVVLVSPFWLAWRTGAEPSLILIVVAVALAALLWAGATNALRSAAETRTLSQVAARDLSRRAIPISEQASVADAMPLSGTDGVVVVQSPAGPLAVVDDAALRAVPVEQWSRVGIRAVAATVAADAPVLPADATADAVAVAFQQTSSRFVFLAAEAGEPLRVIDTAAVFRTTGADS